MHVSIKGRFLTMIEWDKLFTVKFLLQGFVYYGSYPLYMAGAGLSFLAGGVFGWTFGQEVANHWLQLYRLDTMAAQVKFMEWWEKKSEGQS